MLESRLQAVPKIEDRLKAGLQRTYSEQLMRFLSSLALLAVLVTCHVPSLLAQGRDLKELQPTPLGVINDVDITVTDLTEEKLNNPPKREIKVERLDEPLKSKLPKADPKLFEQKLASTLRVQITSRAQYYGAVPRDDK